MLERRSLLAGLAALPAAGLPISTNAAVPHADPFVSYHGDILTLHEIINTGRRSEAETDRLMDRWGEIDAQAMAGQPTTLAGALGALEMARREFVQFQMMDGEETDDTSKNLVLHLMDGVIGLLRHVGAGGVA